MRLEAMLLLFIFALVAPLLQVEGTVGWWESWSPCSKTCGGGVQLRRRKCFGNCIGSTLIEEKSCVNKLCKGLAGLTKSQEVAHLILRQFHKAKTAQGKPHGNFHKTVFTIQETIAREFASLDRVVKRKPLEKRLQDLKKILKVAAEGGSHHFARRTLGKGLHLQMEKRINDGVAVDQLHVDDTLYSDQKSYIDEMTDGVPLEGFLPLTHKASVIIAIDTTGSMDTEIDMVKKIAKKITILNKNNAVNYILAEINDPVVPLAKKVEGKQSSDFLKLINGLHIVSGYNPECEEKSFEAMLNSFVADPHDNSPMFVFTDASPKDANDSNIENLRAYYGFLYQARMYFFTDTKDTWCGKNLEPYYVAAEETGGEVYNLARAGTVDVLSRLFNNYIHQDSTIASGGATSLLYSMGQHHAFNVDSGVKKLHISVETANSISDVVLESPTGQTIKGSPIVSMSRMFEVDQPKLGSWKLKFPSSVGKYKFKAHSISSDPIDFSYHFLYQEHPSEDSPVFVLNQPLKGKENVLSFQLGHINRVDTATLKLDVVTMEGRQIKTLVIENQGGTQDVYHSKLTPPDMPFQLRLKGRTLSGEDFERIARGVSQPSRLHIQAISAGDEFTAKLGYGRVHVQIMILNSGTSDKFNIKIATRHGILSQSSFTKTLRRKSLISFYYTPPSDHRYHGRTDTIFLTAKHKSNDDNLTLAFEVLLMKS